MEKAPAEKSIPWVSVVVPVHGDQDAISGAVSRLRRVLAEVSRPCEIILVEHGSRADTHQQNDGANVRLIRCTLPRREGAAYRAGIQEARGEVVVVLEALRDGDPALLSEMLQYFPDYDQVNGIQPGTSKGSGGNVRRLENRAIQLLVLYFTGQQIPGGTCGVTAFKRDLMLDHLWALPGESLSVPTLSLVLIMNGNPVKYIPVSRSPRGDEVRSRSPRGAVRDLLSVFRLGSYLHPLRVYGPVSLSVLFTGVLTSLYNRFLSPKHSLEESDVILIATGVILGAIGLLADLIVAEGRSWTAGGAGDPQDKSKSHRAPPAAD